MNILKNKQNVINGIPVEEKGIVDGIYYHMNIFDKDKPICITFSNLGQITKDIDIKNPIYRPWGYNYILKKNINVLCFSSFNTPNWYISKDFNYFLTELASLLNILPRRFGYGGSMGGFGTALYSETLNLDKVLLINPISTLNKNVVNFETRFSKSLNLDWDSNLNDSAICNKEGWVIYDPLFDLDRKHALRYKNKTLLKFPGVGHGMPVHLNKLSLLDPIINSFLNGKIDKDWFYREVRKRKDYPHYYKWLLSNENKHLTPKRSDVINRFKEKRIIDNEQNII